MLCQIVLLNDVTDGCITKEFNCNKILTSFRKAGQLLTWR